MYALSVARSALNIVLANTAVASNDIATPKLHERAI